MFLRTLLATAPVLSACLLRVPLADARARASGAKHSTAHGGHYSNGHGCSHKGGQYRSPGTGNQYRRHTR